MNAAKKNAAKKTARSRTPAVTRRADGQRPTGHTSDLDAEIARRAALNPAFPDLVEAAIGRRELLRALAARREELGLTQRAVAEKMGTSQAAVDRLEGGDANAQLRTLERFAAAVDATIEWSIRPAASVGP